MERGPPVTVAGEARDGRYGYNPHQKYETHPLSEIAPTSADADGNPICHACGSEKLLRYVCATWNKQTRRWQVSHSYEHTVCTDCDEVQQGYEHEKTNDGRG